MARRDAGNPVQVLVGGIGYHNQTDLSLGPLVVERLERESWPDHVTVTTLGHSPFEILHWLKEIDPPFGRVVLVSAEDRGRDGPVVCSYRWDGRLPEDEMVQARVVEALTGVVGLDNFLVVTRQFGALPESVYVVEARPIVVEFGVELSEAMETHVPGICRLVRSFALDRDSTLKSCVESGLGGPGGEMDQRR